MSWEPASGSLLAEVDYRYDALGNLTQKEDFASSYTYGQNAGPHAVTSVSLAGGGTVNYSYDPNGNLTGATGAHSTAITYDGFNKPLR
ncbi:hypothetical protein [Elongatibacter sediminis]|uniref:YD repeat-containing protein n=1 Tax=Elongatibacter sediminis TaxID=3119006 RepID=A0AAW9RGB0_9GAMM